MAAGPIVAIHLSAEDIKMSGENQVEKQNCGMMEYWRDGFDGSSGCEKVQIQNVRK